MTTEEIKEQCASLSDEQLLMVVNNKILYTEAIVRAAKQEIRKRGVPKEDIAAFKVKEAQRSKIIDGDIYSDIYLLEKIAFFFLFFPRLHFFVIRDYRKKKFVLKGRQAWFFMLSGALSFFSALGLGELHLLTLLSGGIFWVGCFAAALALNNYYGRQWIIRRLERKTADAEQNELSRPE